MRRLQARRRQLRLCKDSPARGWLRWRQQQKQQAAGRESPVHYSWEAWEACHVAPTVMSCARQHDRAALIWIHQSAGDVGAGSSFPSFLVLITFTVSELPAH